MGCCHPASNTEKAENSSLIGRNTGSFKINPADFVKVNTVSIFDNYIFYETLGTGSFGEVKRAILKSTGAERAVKSISIEALSEEEIEKIMKEVSILKVLDHPNIIRIFEVYRNNSKLFIVNDLCTGKELFDKIQLYKRFGENQAAKYFLDIVSAVMHCHKGGIVHRDLKPENLLFENDREDAKLKLIDFGISRFYKTDKKMKKFIGSVYYMAPEVINGEYDEKCDV